MYVYEDVEAFELYVGERENFMKYSLRLLCPRHGLLAVRQAKSVGNIRSEVGTLARMDYEYVLVCGCRRRKDLLVSFVEIKLCPALNLGEQDKIENDTARSIENKFKNTLNEVAHGHGLHL